MAPRTRCFRGPFIYTRRPSLRCQAVIDLRHPHVQCQKQCEVGEPYMEQYLAMTSVIPGGNHFNSS
ncbi:hypothetical protein LB505_008204 [Fusarium chuoi]|nr:hypothetical protein LB505_008204 [Fusarium chuoi]